MWQQWRDCAAANAKNSRPTAATVFMVAPAKAGLRAAQLLIAPLMLAIHSVIDFNSGAMDSPVLAIRLVNEPVAASHRFVSVAKLEFNCCSRLDWLFFRHNHRIQFSRFSIIVLTACWVSASSCQMPFNIAKRSCVVRCLSLASSLYIFLQYHQTHLFRW